MKNISSGLALFPCSNENIADMKIVVEEKFEPSYEIFRDFFCFSSNQVAGISL